MITHNAKNNNNIIKFVFKDLKADSISAFFVRTGNRGRERLFKKVFH